MGSRLRGNDTYGYSDFAPSDLAILAYFSRSALRRAANSSGELPTRSSPAPVRRSVVSFSLSIATTSGAELVDDRLAACRPGRAGPCRPRSPPRVAGLAEGRRSGRPGWRFGCVTAIGLSLPARMCGMPVEIAPKMRSTLQLIASPTACAEPLVRHVREVDARGVLEQLAGDMLAAAVAGGGVGRASSIFARLITSSTRHRHVGHAISTRPALAAIEIGAKSRSVLNGIFSYTLGIDHQRAVGGARAACSRRARTSPPPPRRCCRRRRCGSRPRRAGRGAPQAVGERAADEVGRAAGRERHEHAHRARRVGLRASALAREDGTAAGTGYIVGFAYLPAERDGAVRRARDVEIEREVLARRLHVAQVALQRIASVDGIRAVERPERLDRLARLRNRERVLRAQAQLRFQVQACHILKQQRRFAHQVARRVDQAARPRELDLHRLEVGDLRAGIGAHPGLE